LRFERGGYGASLCGQAGGRARLADRGHAGTDGQLAGDEVRPARRAAGLSVIVGEQHAFLGELIEVRRSPRHHAAMIGADIPHADVIAMMKTMLGFLSAACAETAMNAAISRAAHRVNTFSFIIYWLFEGFFSLGLLGGRDFPRS